MHKRIRVLFTTTILSTTYTMNPIQITQSDYNLLQDLLARVSGGTAVETAGRESLFRELIRARVVPPSEVAGDVITLGSWACLIDLDSNEVLNYTLSLPEDADANEGRVSILAPLGSSPR